MIYDRQNRDKSPGENTPGFLYMRTKYVENDRKCHAHILYLL